MRGKLFQVVARTSALSNKTQWSPCVHHYAMLPVLPKMSVNAVLCDEDVNPYTQGTLYMLLEKSRSLASFTGLRY